MKVILQIMIFLLIVSCAKDDSYVPENSEKYIWPTSEWIVKEPLSLNVDEGLLNILDTEISSGNYGNVHSLLIIKDGYLVFENYYNGSFEAQAHELQSATKSIASIICGIAIDKNYFSENDSVLNLIHSNYTHDNDPKRNSIRIQNVLDMRLGIDWKEWGYPPSVQDNIIMANSSDWIQYVLNKPMATAPDSIFLYNTGASVFISAIIDNSTPYNTQNFSDHFLFNPIGISSQDWWISDSQNVVHTGGGLKMSARDMARFGFLIAKNGSWDGDQIISQNFLSKITIPTTQNVLNLPVSSGVQPLHYGHHFWNIPMTVNSINYNIIAAMGTGGQVIFVIKELDAVVVSTAWNLTEPNQTSSPLEWLKNYIIPSMQ